MTREGWRCIDRRGWGVAATALVLLAACAPAARNETRGPALGAAVRDEPPASAAVDALLAVQKTRGCGLAPKQELGTFVKYELVTSGAKDANCAAKDANSNPVCGSWSVTREYYVWLPVGYDGSRAYPLLFQGPGCGGSGKDVYALTNAAGPGVGDAVIRVGLTPPPASVGHGTNPNQGCFDDKEGDDSVDFVFYERLVDTLKSQLCYDENRVFVAGNSSGSWLANELACKYSGDRRGYGIRGIVANTGGLPTEAPFRPTCTNAPMSGIWIQEVGDPVNPFAGNLVAINRALAVNGCSSSSYETAQFANYPIGGGNPASTCKLVLGCPVQYPLIVCALDGNAHAPHERVVDPAASTYLSSFLRPPLAK